MERVRIWKPTPATDISFRGLREMHGGPRAMYLPEHEHPETQIQARFLEKAIIQVWSLTGVRSRPGSDRDAA